MQTERIKEQIELLRNLSEIDDTLADLNLRLETIVSKKNELKNSLKDNLSLLESLRKKRKELELEAHRMEKELKEKEKELEGFAAKFHSLKSNREYQQFKEQQEKLRGEVSALEDKAIATLDSVEQLEIDISRKEEEMKKEEENLKQQEKHLCEEEEAIQRDIAYEQEKRRKTVSALPPEVFKKYSRIHSKVKKKTVVSADRERLICNGCFMSITLQELNEILRAEELVCCRQCNRILFVEEKL
ncbi:MAG: C4-type zinc ribbon domain-containing protein [Planctomycetota bacterium]|nr:C4-type zinc ribbon domain-containing protein [Planctomycetota bacterium]